jgi:hypothetical protein
VSAVNVVGAAAVSFIVLLLGKVSLDLVSKELQGQAEQLPHRILRLAARRLPSALRAQYSEEWEDELDHILKWHDARPITRLFLGFRFVTSLFVGARRLRADHMSQPQRSGAHLSQRAWEFINRSSKRPPLPNAEEGPHIGAHYTNYPGCNGAAMTEKHKLMTGNLYLTCNNCEKLVYE